MVYESILISMFHNMFVDISILKSFIEYCISYVLNL